MESKENKKRAALFAKLNEPRAPPEKMSME